MGKLIILCCALGSLYTAYSYATSPFSVRRGCRMTCGILDALTPILGDSGVRIFMVMGFALLGIILLFVFVHKPRSN